MVRDEAAFAEAVNTVVTRAEVGLQTLSLPAILVTGKLRKTVRWTFPLVCLVFEMTPLLDQTLNGAVQKFAKSQPLGDLCWLLRETGYQITHSGEERTVLAVRPATTNGGAR